MATWDEIRRLAADFHRVQLGEVSKRLSERNCIELVTRLRTDELIDIVHTTDGKEYITKNHLETQIKNEVCGNGGRISLSDLTGLLNVEFQHIEHAVDRILNDDPDFVLWVGQLLTQDYLRSICEEVDTWLEEEGQLTIGQITKAYDLPSDLLKEEIFRRIGSVIKGVTDRENPQIIYTAGFVQRQTALVRGLLSAATTPQPLAKCLSKLRIQPGLLLGCVDSLLGDKQLCGSVSGGRQIDRAVFVPEIFKKALAKWLRDFFAQNGYAELSAVRRMGWLDDPVKLLDLDQKIIQLENCLLSEKIWRQSKDEVQEVLENRGYVDVLKHLPSVVMLGDGKKLAMQVLSQHRANDWVLCGETCLLSTKMLPSYMPLFTSQIEEKAASEGPELAKRLKESTSPQHKGPAPDEGKKKGGRGKKGKGRKADDDFAEPKVASANQVQFMDSSAIANFLQENGLEECPDDVLEEIAEQIRPSLDAKFRERLESVFLTSDLGSKDSLKKSHAEFEAKFSLLFQNMYMFDQGSGQFSPNIASDLRGLLLRTLGADLVNLAVSYMSGGMDLNSGKMTPKIRDATIDEFDPSSKDAFHKLIATLTDKESLEPFFEAVDALASPSVCGVSVKFPDKKSRAELARVHQAELKEQLDNSEEPAHALLLSALLCFSCISGHMLNATGKFVPHLMDYLKGKIKPELLLLLSQCQTLVVKKFGSKQPKAGSSLDEELSEKMSELKHLVGECFSQGDKGFSA